MVQNLVVGNVYWCIVPSVEAQTNAQFAPVKPWQGKLRLDMQGCYYLDRFNEVTGEIDDDTNARALVGWKEASAGVEIFRTQKEARIAYYDAVLKDIEQMQRNAKQSLEDLQAYMREHNE